jgi:hypothetical protein
VRGASPSQRGVAIIALAATVGLAAPAGAQDAPGSWPCLAQRDDRAAYVAAFEAEGWTRVEGAARREAMLGPGEFQLLYHRAAANSWRVPPIEDRAAWEAEARALAELLNPPSAVVLVRGEATTVLSLGHSFDRVARVYCIMTAPDLPEADELLARGSRRLGDIEMTPRAQPEPFAGGGTLILTALRYPDRHAPPLAGTEVVTLTLEFGDAP